MPQGVDSGAAAEYAGSMEVPKLYRISAEVEREQKARFRVFSKSLGRTMRAQLTYMVVEAIAEIKLTKQDAESVPSGTGATQLQSVAALRPAAANAQEKFMGLLGDPYFRWIPDAIEEVRLWCEAVGVTDWRPKLPSQGWLDTKYVPRARASGRDVEADIAAGRQV